MKLTRSDILFGALVTWTMVASTLVVRGMHRSHEAPIIASPISTRVTNWRTVASSGFDFGPRDAPTTIVVFSDFQCPYCRQFSLVIDSLRQRRPDVRIVDRQLPIEGLHPQAFVAAIAAECARDVGRYAELRSEMFHHPGLIMDEQWNMLGSAAGVRDLRRFVQCISQREHAEEVRRDVAVAKELGIEATPTVLINDRLVSGFQSLSQLEAALQ